METLKQLLVDGWYAPCGVDIGGTVFSQKQKETLAVLRTAGMSREDIVLSETSPTRNTDTVRAHSVRIHGHQSPSKFDGGPGEEDLRHG